MSDWLTATEARDSTFGKPPTGRRGYNEDEVHAFPERAEAAIAPPDSRR